MCVEKGSVCDGGSALEPHLTAHDASLIQSLVARVSTNVNFTIARGEVEVCKVNEVIDAGCGAYVFSESSERRDVYWCCCQSKRKHVQIE